jgi:ABC-type glycerol-3-phosphate transport system permease component
VTLRHVRTVPTVAGAVIILALTYIPLLFVLSNSLKSTAQFVMDPFGLFNSFRWQNYLVAWGGVALYLRNTFAVAALSVLIGIPSAAVAAYGFAQWHFKGKQWLFVAYLGLLMIPWTLTLIPLFVEMKSMSLFNSWWALIFLFRTFFEGIPIELIESGRLDGCSEGGVLIRIVAPLSIPVLFTGMILMLVSIWGDYIWPLVVLPDYHLLTISAGLQLFVSNFGNTGHGLGPEFAAYVIAMAPIIIVISAAMRYFVNGVTSGALKA